jgi:hypothetical protein
VQCAVELAVARSVEPVADGLAGGGGDRRCAGTGLSARTNHWKDTRGRGHPLAESRAKSTDTNLTAAPDRATTHSQSFPSMSDFQMEAVWSYETRRRTSVASLSSAASTGSRTSTISYCRLGCLTISPGLRPGVHPS